MQESETLGDTLAVLRVRRLSPSLLVVTSPELPGLCVHGNTFAEVIARVPQVAMDIHEALIGGGSPEQMAAYNRVLD